jgi:hypothetical protein
MSMSLALARMPADPPHERALPRNSSEPVPSSRSELLFRVELWDDSGSRPEMLLATARTMMVAYAAYFAAVSDFPRRIITLRCERLILARWSVRYR